MRSYGDSMMRRLLICAVLVFLTVTLFGCLDPIVKDMEAEHERLTKVCQQEMRQSPSGLPAPSRTGTLYPAP